MTRSSATRLVLGLGLWLPLVAGCAAFRPIPGVPARYVPDEFRGASRSGKRTIDLSLLRQTPPAAHRVDSGDLLSIYIEGILGRRDEQPPVYFPQNQEVPPTVGYPLPVREDGTVSLPMVGAIPVRGMTLVEVEDQIRKAYTVDKQILNPHLRIVVFLQRPRSYRVLVIRQEASSDVSISQGGMLNIGMLKRGTGKVVNLPVYRNDVLNALAETGGLPGLDAENAIYVIRNGKRTGVAPTPWSMPPGAPPAAPAPHAARADGLRPLIRAQSPNWGAPPVNPHVDYRRAAPAPNWGQGPAPTGDYRTAPPSRPAANTSAQPPVPQPQVAPQPDPAYFAPQQPVSAPHWPAPPVAAPPQPYVPAAPQWPQPAPPAEAPAAVAPVTPPLPPSPGAPLGMTPALPPPPPAAPQSDYALPFTPPPGPPGEWAPMDGALGDSLDGRHIIRIPVRLAPGDVADIREPDITLYDGDIIFIESRDTEVFYTGGLLGGGQYSLPRDYDLDILGAIAIAQGQRAGGGGGGRATSSVGGQSALNADVSISASQVVVLRPLPDGTQLPIRIDLYHALRDPAERIVVQPGDYILLQYTRLEAVGAFIERHLLEGALFSVASSQMNGGGN